MEKNYYLRTDKDIYLKKWSIEGDKAKLEYEDGAVLYVKKSDFDRAFGCIICCTKDEIIQNFAI